MNLTRYHGVFTPNSAHRAQVTKAQRGQRLRVPTTSTYNSRLNLSGWVAPLLGRHSLIRTQHGNREGFEATINRWFETLDEIWHGAPGC